MELHDAPAKHAGRIDRVALLLILITLVGAGLRLYHLSERSLWYDEAFTIRLANLIAEGENVFNPTNNFDAPFPGLATLIWRNLTFSDFFPVTSPARDFILRLLPALCSIACIPLLFLATTTIGGDRYAGLIAAFLFAISPFHIYYAQELRGYAMTSVIGVLAFYFLVRALDTQRHRDYIALVFLEALLMYTHFTNVWAIIVFNMAALLAIVQSRAIFWRWTAYQALMLVLVAPAVYLAHEGNKIFLAIEHPWGNYPMPTLKLALITFKSFFAGYGPSTWAYWPLFLLAVVFFVLGVVALRTRWRNAALVALLVVFPIAINVVFWRMRDLSLYEHRIFTYYGIVALVAIASGIRILPRVSWQIAALAAMTGLTVPGLLDYYAHRLHPTIPHRIAIFDKVDFRSAADHIREQWHEGDILAHDSNFTVISMLHYLPVEQYHLGSQRDAAIYIEHVAPEAVLSRHQLLPVPPEVATANAKRVWLLEPFGVIFDDQPQTIPARDWLNEHFTLAETKVFDGLRLYRFDRP